MTHLKQRIGGIDVHGSDVRVLARGPRLVAISGRPRALGAGRQAAFGVAAEAALAAALSHRFSIAVPPSSVTPVAGDPASRARRFGLAAGAGLSLSEPAAVSPVFYPVGATLVAAYLVEFYAGTGASSDADAFRYVVAADDGRVLDVRNLTVHEGNPTSRPAFTYRVFADPTATCGRSTARWRISRRTRPAHPTGPRRRTSCRACCRPSG